jgi:hypothetical protein
MRGSPQQLPAAWGLRSEGAAGRPCAPDRIHVETALAKHSKTPEECAKAATATFREFEPRSCDRDKDGFLWINDKLGPSGTFAANFGMTFMIRCDIDGLAFSSASFAPWPLPSDRKWNPDIAEHPAVQTAEKSLLQYRAATREHPAIGLQDV